MLARLLIGSLLILAAPAVRAGAWEELVDAGYAYTRAQGEKLEKEFSISKHERWDLDQDTGELVFSNKGKPAVVAKIQFVGSLSTKSKTWLWSWANNSIDPKLSAGMQAVREHGRKNGFTKLTESRWSADNADGWEMTAVANYLLKGKGVYRPPFEGGFSYVVITDIRKAAPR